jgi:hypothetical protein
VISWVENVEDVAAGDIVKYVLVPEVNGKYMELTLIKTFIFGFQAITTLIQTVDQEAEQIFDET